MNLKEPKLSDFILISDKDVSYKYGSKSFNKLCDICGQLAARPSRRCLTHKGKWRKRFDAKGDIISAI